MAGSKINWCNDGLRIPTSWNPIDGCTPISPGCAHCWARKMANRFSRDEFRPTVHLKRRFQPDHWRKPRRIFVCSMGDLFHKDISFGHIRNIFDVMLRHPEHIFMVLTKRAERMREWWNRFMVDYDISFVAPRNIWIGVSVENHEYAAIRIPELLACNGNPVRFISAEPMIGDIALTNYISDGTADSPPIAWVIAGGESGPPARPMNPNWAKRMRDVCAAYHIPFYFKQWGEWMPAVQYSLCGDIVYPAAWATNSVLPDRTVHPWGNNRDGMIRRRYMECPDNPNDNLDGRRWHQFPMIENTDAGFRIKAIYEYFDDNDE